MKARSTYVPGLEKLEDRSIPGSLLGLADLSLGLFADLPAPGHSSKSVARAASLWSESPQAEPVVPVSPRSLSSFLASQSQGKGSPRLVPPSISAIATSDLELAIAALAASTIAAGPRGRQAAAPRVQITAEANVNAFAFYSHTEGCFTTDIAVTGNKGTMRSSPPQEIDGTSALHGLVVFFNNDCTDQPLVDAQSFSTDPGMFHVAPDLRSATLSGTFFALNVTDGSEIDFTVSVTWAATGRAVSETAVNRFDGSLEVLHTQERPAIASGTVIAGTTNYFAGPTADAAVQAVQSVTVTY